MKLQKKYSVSLFALLLSGILILSVSILSGYALLSWNTEDVDNTFTSAQSGNPEVIETFDGTTKSNVQVQVPSVGYSCYVRAAISVTWQNSNGEILAQSPVYSTDYTMSLNLTDWFDGGDGFYYYRYPVNSTQTTSSLILSAAQKKDADQEGYALNITITAQSIQSAGQSDDGVAIVTEAWKRSVDENGYLS